MSSKQQTDTSMKFNPASMANYNMFQGAYGKALMNYDPTRLQNAWMQQANQQIGQIGNRMNSNLMQNTTTGGWGGGNLPAFMQAGIARNSRAIGGMQGNAFLNTLQMGEQANQWKLGQMGAYRPLQTGGTQTQTTSGLGTWLPQLAGAAISGAMGAATGGMSTMAQHATSAGSGGGAWGAPNPWQGGGIGMASTPSYWGGNWGGTG